MARISTAASAPEPPPQPGAGTPSELDRDPSGADPFVEVSRRLNNVNGAGAGLITLLIVISIWGNWRALIAVAAIQALVIAFNVWVTLVYLPRRGRRAELVRTAVNLSTGIVVNHLAGWPFPVWLWLPFVALAFDHLDRHVARWTLFGFVLVQNTTALLAGVDWIYPLSATSFAIFCSEISRLRFAVIRGMLLESDQQKKEIERAHASLGEAHEQLTIMTRAREDAERELRQAQKLEAVGRLAAGVAHEINTPVQFVNDSIHFLQDASQDLMRVIGALQRVRVAVEGNLPALEAASAAVSCESDADLPYLLENVPKALARAREGTERVAVIVRSMKDFAHPDSKVMEAIDLNRAVESTLTIARSEYKYVADLETELGELPLVTCHAGDLNQALLNIVVNAAHAIGDVVRGSENRGLIRVRTYREDGDVVIAVADTGGGIPEHVRDRIFDPFFTTKEIGKGTGQGLAIARSVVNEKHGGTLTFTTEPGVGTTFFIRIPIDGAGAQHRTLDAAE